MRNYNEQVITEALKVVSPEEMIIALLGEDEAIRAKVTIVVTVLQDEFDKGPWSEGSSEIDGLNNIDWNE